VGDNKPKKQLNNILKNTVKMPSYFSGSFFMPYIRSYINLKALLAAMKKTIAFTAHIDSILAAIAGFFVIQLLAKHGGIGISPDSVTYISAARNFMAGKGLLEFDNVPMVDFPAFYPIFLATISSISKIDPVAFGPLLNGLMFALLLLLSGSMMNKFYYPSRWYKVIILSFLVISPCLLEVYSMMWSETLFILLVMIFIDVFRIYLDRENLPLLVLVAILAGLACVTRYAGVTVIATGGMLIVLNYRMNFNRRIVHLLIFCAISSSLMILNLARNASVSGTYTGMRQKGITPLIQNLSYFGEILCDWLPLPKDNPTLALLVTIGSILLLGIVLFTLFLTRKGYHSYEHIAVVFCLVYIGFMLLSATVSRYEQFTSRLLSPLFIPLIWGLTGLIPWWIQKLPGPGRAWMVGMGVLLAACFQYNQWEQDSETWEGVKDAGIPGYTEDPWPQSPLLDFVNKNKNLFKPGYSLYSNAADYVYFYTGLHPYNLPQKVFPQEQKKFYADPRHYVIWFKDIDNPDLTGIEEVRKNQFFIPLDTFTDGTIYISVDTTRVIPSRPHP
jgi:hypothetical protein